MHRNKQKKIDRRRIIEAFIIHKYNILSAQTLYRHFTEIVIEFI